MNNVSLKRREEQTEAFGDLLNGTCFHFEHGLYVKISNEPANNAVDLNITEEQSIYADFDADDVVTLVDEIEYTLKLEGEE